ncbi:MAG: acetyl-CoA carboxylase biotin carboxyl carrier protein [Candidatus Krumholzibacteria bacterium]|nr:acetyl-CoA carboxylase biotin carboxyl carrier protein [Candidatus Krumholzibacteria bacterium]
MDIDKVRELVKLVEDSGIEELEVSNEDTTIRIQKSAPVTMAAASVATAMQAPMQPISVPGAGGPAAADTPAVAADPSRAKWKDVRSPIVGTFYRAPSPTSPVFAEVGDRVTTGQTLCIIEAMKVMNEIEAEFSGTIKEIFAEDGNPVEAEAVLFLIDPD